MLFSVATSAKKITIKSGTIVPLESIKEIKAANTHIGESIDFRVTHDVKIGNLVAIPAGAIAKGAVFEAKRSTAFGTKGRLGIKLRYVTLPSGDNISLASSEVYIQGKNRTPLSVVIFCFTCLPFPCGSKAVMPLGYECDATVGVNTEINIE